MTLTLSALLVYLLIAAICGAIGSALAGGRVGILSATALGFIGAIFGPLIARALHLHEPLTIIVQGHPFPVLWSIVGAALFVALLHLLAYRRPLARRW